MDAAALPADWTSLVALVFLLGLKHGFDADHLATIDGLTRVNSRAGRPFARYCGALFSVGHGAVVLLIALLVGSATSRWETPAWLETSGVWISILFLTTLGLINIRAVLTAAPDEVVQPVGLKGRFLGRLARAGSPGLVALVGALFALSFDTISQAALFALTATQFGGVGHALMLGVVFTVGMLVTDGINGLWISRLILRSDEIARVASRVIGLAVGTVSLLIAAFSGGKLLFPALEAWSEGKELAFGAAVILVVFGSFVLGRALARGAAPHSLPGDRPA
jgi:high-affinity nickel-transport protein